MFDFKLMAGAVFIYKKKTAGASNVKLVSKTEVSCSLDLKGKAVGQWDVVVGNIGSMSKKDKPTIIAGGFTIEYPALTVTGIQPNQGTG